MIEIPEAKILSFQLQEKLLGKRIIYVEANKSNHKFAWYFNDPLIYPSILNNEVIKNVIFYGGIIEIETELVRLCLAEGVSFQLINKDGNLPQKHQLLLAFDDGTYLVCSIRMYGGLWAIPKSKVDEINGWLKNYLENAQAKPNPIIDAFSISYFNEILNDDPNESLKQILTTKGRIPGLGNGVLQDILFHANLHPRKKVKTLTNEEKNNLFQSIKTVLKTMIDNGGRDSETDLYNHKGGYKTLSTYYKNEEACPKCHDNIIKEQYMGGSIYYCPSCQKLN